MERTSTVVINRQTGIVVKTFTVPEYKQYDLFANEVKWLTRLQDFNRVPEMLSNEPNQIVMTYVGNRLSKKNIPSDWEPQIRDIADGLERYRCSHNDIKVDEVMVKDGRISVIDFGWATGINEDLPTDWPSNLEKRDNYESLLQVCLEAIESTNPLEPVEVAWAKQEGRAFPGSNLHDNKAYHEIPGISHLPVHRLKTQLRIDLIKQWSKVESKTVLDIGCAVGGVSQGLARNGAIAYGVDYDLNAIRVAKECSQVFELDTNFIVMDVKAFFDEWMNPGQNMFGFPDKFDIVVWFGQFMWTVKQYGLEYGLKTLNHVSKCSSELWFTTAAGEDDGMAGDALADWGENPSASIQKALEENTVYSKIINRGFVEDGWFKRPIFHCTK